jgi:predicted small lipoprotein YifL
MLKRTAAILVAASLAGAGLAGCGQKGPLYLPEYPKDAAWPQLEPPRKGAAPAPRTPDLPGTSDDKK